MDLMGRPVGKKFENRIRAGRRFLRRDARWLADIQIGN